MTDAVVDRDEEQVLLIGRPFRAEEESDADLDVLLREAEGEMRRWAARRAAVVAEAERRRVYAADGHSSVAAWVRVVTGCSLGESLSVRRLARLMREFDQVDDAVQDARLSPERVDLIARAAREPALRGPVAGVHRPVVDPR